MSGVHLIFLVLHICFNLTYCHNKPLVECSFLTRDQALSLWNGSTDFKTLDYQRTNPREYQMVRTHTKKTTWMQDWHHQTTSSTLCRMPHLNNKQNKNTNPIIIREDYRLTQPCPSEGKQRNKQKLRTNLTLHEAYTNHWTNLRRAETKRKKEFSVEALEKETSNTVS